MVVVLYPQLLRVFKQKPVAQKGINEPFAVSVLIVARHAADRLAAKLHNTLQVIPDPVTAEILVVSDGPDAEMKAIASEHSDPRISYAETPCWGGKNQALNYAMSQAKHDYLVFTDVDAHLESDALRHLLGAFQDPCVGGVCGLRVPIRDDGSPKGQHQYLNWDANIKNLESAIGSLTSNDGKLYAVRSPFATEIPPAVTDDLYMALQVVKRGGRFVFAPKARAYIPSPVRNYRHEWSRRIRIVSRSVRGLLLQRELLNPLKFGRYALQLGINKGLRRLLLLHLLMCMGSIVWFAFPLIRSAKVAVMLIMLAIGCGLPLLICTKKSLRESLLYALIGMAASLVGVGYALCGKSTVKWQPRKSS